MTSHLVHDELDVILSNPSGVDVAIVAVVGGADGGSRLHAGAGSGLGTLELLGSGLQKTTSSGKLGFRCFEVGFFNTVL